MGLTEVKTQYRSLFPMLLSAYFRGDLKLHSRLVRKEHRLDKIERRLAIKLDDSKYTSLERRKYRERYARKDY